MIDFAGTVAAAPLASSRLCTGIDIDIIEMNMHACGRPALALAVLLLSSFSAGVVGFRLPGTVSKGLLRILSPVRDQFACERANSNASDRQALRYAKPSRMRTRAPRGCHILCLHLNIRSSEQMCKGLVTLWHAVRCAPGRNALTSV